MNFCWLYATTVFDGSSLHMHLLHQYVYLLEMFIFHVALNDSTTVTTQQHDIVVK